MEEFIKKPKEVTAAIARARAAEKQGLLLTPLKRFQFESRKNYGDGDDFSIEKGELFIAFTKESHEYEYFLNGERIITSPTIEALDNDLWGILNRIINNYLDIKNTKRNITSFPDLSERKLAEHMVLIYNASADYVNTVFDDDLSLGGYFSSSTNTFFKDVLSIYLHKYLVCIKDNYKTLGELIKLVKRGDI